MQSIRLWRRAGDMSYRHLSPQPDAAGEGRRRTLVKRTQDGLGSRRAGEAGRAGSGQCGHDVGETETTAREAAAVHDLFLSRVLSTREVLGPGP